MELPIEDKLEVLTAQLNETLRIKFRNQIEIKRAEYAIKKMQDISRPEVATYLEAQRSKINEATFNISQCEDTLAVLQDMQESVEQATH